MKNKTKLLIVSLFIISCSIYIEPLVATNLATNINLVAAYDSENNDQNQTPKASLKVNFSLEFNTSDFSDKRIQQASQQEQHGSHTDTYKHDLSQGNAENLSSRVLMILERDIIQPSIDKMSLAYEKVITAVFHVTYQCIKTALHLI